MCDVYAIKHDAARGSVANAQDGKPYRRLAAAALAHEPKRLAARYFQVHTVQRSDGASLAP